MFTGQCCGSLCENNFESMNFGQQVARDGYCCSTIYNSGTIERNNNEVTNIKIDISFLRKKYQIDFEKKEGKSYNGLRCWKSSKVESDYQLRKLNEYIFDECIQILTSQLKFFIDEKNNVDDQKLIDYVNKVYQDVNINILESAALIFDLQINYQDLLDEFSKNISDFNYRNIILLCSLLISGKSSLEEYNSSQSCLKNLRDNSTEDRIDTPNLILQTYNKIELINTENNIGSSSCCIL